ncbi:MAG TPA: hypothetical protein VK484_02170 [Ferruginibacter sp.]|nr:hypothetical protein [Ferruginibacter sp.]
MKKTVLILLLAITAGTSSYAQCDKKSVLTSGVTEYLTSTGEVRKTVEEPTTIEFDSKTISIAPGDHVMDGTVTSITCDWKTPYKEGKTVIKAAIAAGDGQTMNVTITIEGKDGKVILMFEENADKRIRLTADKFEERR